jgi:FkbM family methyltransferase
MSIKCAVIDAGARYGLHPSWAELRGLVEFHLFEMDGQEAERLQRKYRNDSQITVYPLALYSSDTTLRYHVTQHRALNSVMCSNDDLLRQNDYMLRDFAVTEECATEARSVDSLFADRDVHFLKLDVEGAEHELLQGAREKLRTSVLGVRSEVLFSPVYKGAALFGDLHREMLEAGFELLNFDYTGAGNKAGRFTLPGRYGKLLSSDAVWVVGCERVFAAQGARRVEDVVRLALFLMLNGATDLAVDLLTRAVTCEGVSLVGYRDDPLFMALHRRVLLLFKSLLGLPMLQEKDITSTYKTIFGRDFPLMNEFYQSELLQ